MSIDDYEIAHSISVLERNGYIVRKPSEADVPVVLKVLPDELWKTVDVRADVLINGETCALIERFPDPRVICVVCQVACHVRVFQSVKSPRSADASTSPRGLNAIEVTSWHLRRSATRRPLRSQTASPRLPAVTTRSPPGSNAAS